MDIQTAQANLAAAEAANTQAWQASQAAQQAVAQARADLQQAQEDLAAQVMAGTIATVTSVDRLLQAERDAGIPAVVQAIKANPAISEDQAASAWIAAATASTGLKTCIIPPQNLLAVYAANAVADHLIPDASWASLAAWIVATPAETISKICGA